MQKYEIPQNCPFSLPFPTVIAFHRVKKSPLIIGIVDRIKINSDRPLPFSESELSIQYFLQIVRMTYVCLVYFAAIAQVCVNLHRQHLMSFIQWWCERGSKSQVAEEMSGRGRRKSDWRFSFHKYFTFFPIYYYYYFLSFFSILFYYPRHLPTPHDPRHLATRQSRKVLWGVLNSFFLTKFNDTRGQSPSRVPASKYPNSSFQSLFLHFLSFSEIPLARGLARGDWAQE